MVQMIKRVVEEWVCPRCSYITRMPNPTGHCKACSGSGQAFVWGRKDDQIEPGVSIYRKRVKKYSGISELFGVSNE